MERSDFDNEHSFNKGIALIAYLRIDCVGTSAVFLFRFALLSVKILDLCTDGCADDHDIDILLRIIVRIETVRGKEGGNSTRNMLQNWQEFVGSDSHLRACIPGYQEEGQAE